MSWQPKKDFFVEPESNLLGFVVVAETSSEKLIQKFNLAFSLSGLLLLELSNFSEVNPLSSWAFVFGSGYTMLNTFLYFRVTRAVLGAGGSAAVVPVIIAIKLPLLFFVVAVAGALPGPDLFCLIAGLLVFVPSSGLALSQRFSRP